MKIVVTFNNQIYEGEFTESPALKSAFANMLVDIMNQTKLLRPTGLVKDFTAIEKNGAIFLQYGEESHHCLRIDNELKPDFQDQLEYWFRSHIEGDVKYGPGITVSHNASVIKCDLKDLNDNDLKLSLEQNDAIVAIITKLCKLVVVAKKETRPSSVLRQSVEHQSALLFAESVKPGTEASSETDFPKNG